MYSTEIFAINKLLNFDKILNKEHFYEKIMPKMFTKT